MTVELPLGLLPGPPQTRRSEPTSAVAHAQPGPPATERDMLDALHVRFGLVAANKPRYVKAEHVRATTGFDCGTADFIAVDTWRSGNVAVHGVEVKVSRSDWLRELKAPWKSEPFRAWCHYWWLAVPDRAMVKDGELPGGWGLLTAVRRSDGWVLRQAAPAPRKDAPPIPPASFASLLYAAARTAAVRGHV